MSITEILTRADGSAGGTKANRRPPPNRIHFWPADEMNKVLDWVAAASAELGKSDGSTLGSVLRKLLSFSGPRESEFVLFDDFVKLNVDGATVGEYTFAVVGASSALAKASPAEAGAGVGVLELIAAASGGALVRFAAQHHTIRGTNLPDLRFRLKTPATFVGVDFHIGVSETGAAPTSYARMRCNASGLVTMEARSATGGGTGSTASAVTLAASTWYEGRIRVTSGRVDFYVNDALIGSNTTPAQVPSVSGDTMSPFAMTVSRSAGGPHTELVDWWELRGTRL